jgi:hypothetical protein
MSQLLKIAAGISPGFLRTFLIPMQTSQFYKLVNKYAFNSDNTFSIMQLKYFQQPAKYKYTF